jgi:hypothetical protein
MSLGRRPTCLPDSVPVSTPDQCRVRRLSPDRWRRQTSRCVDGSFGSGLIPGFGLRDWKSFSVSAPDRWLWCSDSDFFFGLGSGSGSVVDSGSSTIWSWHLFSLERIMDLIHKVFKNQPLKTTSLNMLLEFYHRLGIKDKIRKLKPSLCSVVA